jgi:hypothetical protein
MFSDQLPTRQSAELALFAIHAAHDALGVNFEIADGSRFEKTIDGAGRGSISRASKSRAQAVGLPGVADQNGRDNAAQKPYDKLLRD